MAELLIPVTKPTAPERWRRCIKHNNNEVFFQVKFSIAICCCCMFSSNYLFLILVSLHGQHHNSNSHYTHVDHGDASVTNVVQVSQFHNYFNVLYLHSLCYQTLTFLMNIHRLLHDLMPRNVLHLATVPRPQTLYAAFHNKCSANQI